MTKQQAIKVSAVLIQNIYLSKRYPDIAILKAVKNAEADKDVDWLCSTLDEVIDFCWKLKKAMFNQK